MAPKYLMTVFFALLAVVQLVPAAEPTFPGPKSWWAHKVDSEVYTGGRMTSRLVKYAHEVGFKSIISLFTFGEEADWGSDEKLITTAAESALAAEINLKFYTVHNEAETTNKTWKNTDSIRRFGEIFKDAERPVLVHCACSHTAAAYIHLYWFKEDKFDSVEDMFNSMVDLGFDPGTPDNYILNLANEIGEEDFDEEDVPDDGIDLTTEEWCDNFWMVKPVHGRVFAAGQIQKNHLSLIKAAGFDAVVNLRIDGEEVTLLNIKDNTGADRQKKENLEKNIIDTNKKNSYISTTSSVNYESTNPLEFGDSVAYNETKEEVAFDEEDDLTYHHTPIDFDDHDIDKWRNYMEDTWENIDGNILFHGCHSARAMTAALLFAVRDDDDLDSDWALKRANLFGYDFSSDSIKSLMREVGDGASGLQACTTMIGLIAAACLWFLKAQ